MLSGGLTKGWKDMFRKVAQNTAKEDVAQQILAAITEGRLAQDEKLPAERQLAEQFAVSRATIREAMQHLSTLGVVETRRGLGTFVRGARPDRDDLNPEMLMEARFAIEPYIAQLCAVRATRSDLEQIEHFLAESERADADFEHWDNEFHLAIAHATRSALLSRSAEDIFNQRSTSTWGFLKNRSLTPPRVRTYYGQHRNLFQAIQNRDPEAADRSMRIHLFTASYAILGTWPPLPAGWTPIESADLPDELQTMTPRVGAPAPSGTPG